MIQNSIHKISTGLGAYWDSLRDFWKDKTLTEGYQVALAEFSNLADDALAGKTDFIRASGGAAIGLAGLFGSLPLAINDWAIQVAKEIPKGPGETIYRFFEVPISGMLQSAAYLSSSFRNWSQGSLANQNSFNISKEVTTVLGGLVFLASGTRSIAKGGGKIVGGLNSLQIYLPRRAMATASVGMDISLVLQGGLEIFGGTVAWMGSTKVDEATLVAALEKNQGDRAKTGRAVGLVPSSVKCRIDRAKPNSPLARFKGIKGRGGVRSAIDDMTLASLLEKYGGNRTRTAEDVGITNSAIKSRILRAESDSPLAPFKELKGKRKAVVDEAKLAQALERHGGNRSRAAMEVGIAHTTVATWIKNAKEGSPLKPFQGPKRKGSGGGRKARFSDAALVEVLERHQGNRSSAARELGISESSIRPQIRRAEEGSPLKRFETIKSKGSATPKVDDVTLASALENHGGNQTRAGREVGLTPGSVSHRIRDARPDSPLKRFQGVKGKGGVAPRVDDATLAGALVRQRGNIRKAGREVGLSRTAIEERVDRAIEGSPLYPFQGTRSRIKVKDAILAEALERHQGNRTRAGKEVELAFSCVAKRVRESKPDSPLYRFKEMKERRGRPPKVEDVALARKKKERIMPETQPRTVEPKKHKPKKEKIIRPPKKIPRSREMIALRFQAAPDASPLARIVKGRVADSSMASVLRSHKANVSAAAKTLGSTPQVIRTRLQILREHPEWLEGSPLKDFVSLVDD